MSNWFFNAVMTGALSRWRINSAISREKILQLMLESKDSLIQWARFAGSFSRNLTLRQQLLDARECNSAASLEEWIEKVRSYPAEPLTAIPGAKEVKRLTRLKGKEAAVKAYILDLYMKKLFELIEVPEVVKNDLSTLLNDYAPRGARQAEKVQRAFLDNPSYADNITEMAKEIKVNRTTIQNLMTRGIVVCPDERQWGESLTVKSMAIRQPSRSPGVDFG